MCRRRVGCAVVDRKPEEALTWDLNDLTPVEKQQHTLTWDVIELTPEEKQQQFFFSKNCLLTLIKDIAFHSHN